MTTGHTELDEAIANAREAGEDNTVEGAVAALYPCETHCHLCAGEDHHWLPDYADDGEPLMVCKHCHAWRFHNADED